jgi:hypothetical protein
MRQRLMLATIIAALAAVAIGCGSDPAAPGTTPDQPLGVDRLHVQAQAALDRWAAAAKAANNPDVGIVGELTGQIGDWELQAGENNKTALMAGLVRAAAGLDAADLPAERPAPASVEWADGTSATVPVLSAMEALAAISASAPGSSCDTCQALEVVVARLKRGDVMTPRGPATAPTWRFSVRGTRVIVTRVAIAWPIVIEPPPWDPNDPPVGIGIDGAVGLPGDQRLVVSFIGSPGEGDEPCGADYTTEAVESDLAIVVIVTEHPNDVGGACRLVGAIRTATVELAKPLGRRAVLEVKEGRPVQVMTP